MLAFEVQARLRLAAQGMSSGGAFHHPGVSGAMGAVTGAGKLLDLSANQFCMAFGNAGSRAGTMMANHGTMTKPSHSGLGARMGTEAALLAKRGFTAADDIFGSGEFLQTFYGTDNCNADLLLRDFGNPWRMVEPGVAFKRYPAKYSIHRAIEAAIGLACKNDLNSDNIDTVEIVYPATKLIDRPRPGCSIALSASRPSLTLAASPATWRTYSSASACVWIQLFLRISQTHGSQCRSARVTVLCWNNVAASSRQWPAHH